MFNRKEYMREYSKKYYLKNIIKLKNYRHQWYLNNIERLLKLNKEYRKENKNKISEYKKDYHKKNRERILKCVNKWRENNLDKANKNIRKYSKTEKGKAAIQRAKTKRRAVEKNIINTLTAQEWADILEEHNYVCAYCGVEFNCELLPTKDHIIPIIKGGNNTRENIVPACQSCNSRKGKLQYQF